MLSQTGANQVNCLLRMWRAVGHSAPDVVEFACSTSINLQL